ncbi:MAG: tRNA pseudouridine(38-40) synthase TruA [Magnetococcales bacterium]|nr:tRNA pseudouridine(38-40) synthase TruA [Magnetococcales bacterium]MBF0630436.1 tRNA pseudouridine(38-40) synthase TruA [Magnetococcales bacterium]
MPRFRLLLEYDGGPFSGWQLQPGLETVQGVLEQRLEVLCGHPVRVIGAGRTDTGVHALGQVCHFDTFNPRAADVYVRALNAAFRVRLTVLECREVAADFHARHSARYREYLYRIHLRPQPSALEQGRMWHVGRPLDRVAMEEASRVLLGTHDFSAFRAASCQSRSPIRQMKRIEWIDGDQELRIVFGANGFLHHQVRNMVGSLVAVGLGRWSVPRFREVFDHRDRTRAAATAPPWGLYLTRVEYEGEKND